MGWREKLIHDIQDEQVSIIDIEPGDKLQAIADIRVTRQYAEGEWVENSYFFYGDTCKVLFKTYDFIECHDIGDFTRNFILAYKDLDKVVKV